MSADREQDHLDMMTGMLDHHYTPGAYQLWRDEAEREELSNEEMLERGKCELIGASERVAQLVASAAATYYGMNLQEMLADSFYRSKFGLKARQL